MQTAKATPNETDQVEGLIQAIQAEVERDTNIAFILDCTYLASEGAFVLIVDGSGESFEDSGVFAPGFLDVLQCGSACVFHQASPQFKDAIGRSCMHDKTDVAIGLSSISAD